MEKLIEIMVNEGLDEDTIVNVISNLMNEEVEEETHSLSESCFNDIIGLVETIINEKLFDGLANKGNQFMEQGSEKDKQGYMKNPLKYAVGSAIRTMAHGGNQILDKIDNSKVGEIIRKNPIVKNTYGKMKLRQAENKVQDAYNKAFKTSEKPLRPLGVRGMSTRTEQTTDGWNKFAVHGAEKNLQKVKNRYGFN